MLESIESPNVIYTRHDARVIEAKWKAEAPKVDKNGAQAEVSFRKSLHNNPVGIIIHSIDTSHMDKDAQAYLGEEGTEGVSAVAILAPSLWDLFVIWFVMLFAKKTVPIRLFLESEFDIAKRWVLNPHSPLRVAA